jgi:hypothetical protein
MSQTSSVTDDDYPVAGPRYYPWQIAVGEIAVLRSPYADMSEVQVDHTWVPNGTRVRVLGYAEFLVKVEIVAGKFKGQSGWAVQRCCVKQ